MMLGIIVHFVAFYLIFFNMPNDAPIAPMEGTDDVAYMIPRYVNFFLCNSRWIQTVCFSNRKFLEAALGEEYTELSYLLITTSFSGVFLTVCMKIICCQFVQTQLLTCN